MIHKIRFLLSLLLAYKFIEFLFTMNLIKLSYTDSMETTLGKILDSCRNRINAGVLIDLLSIAISSQVNIYILINN